MDPKKMKEEDFEKAAQMLEVVTGGIKFTKVPDERGIDYKEVGGMETHSPRPEGIQKELLETLEKSGVVTTKFDPSGDYHDQETDHTFVKNINMEKLKKQYNTHQEIIAESAAEEAKSGRGR